MAHSAFDAIKSEMQALAPAIAKEKGLATADYRDVIRALKKEQLVAVLARFAKK
jgi:hypothetical protein